MITPTDEVSLATGLASVQTTLGEHGKRFDRVEGKLDTVITRIDVVYPELATLKQRVNSQEQDIAQLQDELKDQRKLQRGILFAAIGTAVTLFANALFGGFIHIGG